MRSLFKLLYWLYRFSSGVRYRVQRRLTGAGLAVFWGVVLAAVMAPDTDSNVAYQGFTVLFFLLIFGSLFAGWFRFRYAAERVLPRFGTAGTPLQYTVLVQNLTKRPQQGLTLLESLADPRPSFEQWLDAQMADERRMRPFRLNQARRTKPFKFAQVRETAVPMLPPGQQVSVTMQLTPLKRGVLRLSGMTLARADPLGLVRAFSRKQLPQSVLILPRRYPLRPLALPGTMQYQQGGVALASHVGQSDEFVALRDYRRGDPLRHIHWRSWARAGKPVVREFEDEFFVRHALVLDTFAQHGQREACEEAISVAASFACTLSTQESLLDLLFVGPDSYCFTAGRNVAHADQMLEILASVEPCRAKPFSELEHLVLNHVKVVSGCICVLLAWDKARQSLVEKLQALGIPLLVLVVLEPSQAKDVDPGPMRQQADRFVVLQLGQIEQGLAKVG